MTLQDIVKELEKPARDPREDMPKPILRSDVLEIKDLTPGDDSERNPCATSFDFGAVCRYWCSSGRTGAYLPDHRPLYQASGVRY